MENDNVKFKNKVAIIISPNWRDYAVKYLSDCVASIKEQDYAGELKIFITDNESTEKSCEHLESVLCEDKIPSAFLNKGAKAEIIRNKNNDGFAKGNNDAIKLALQQGFQYIILFNMDTVLESDCVRRMVEAAGGGEGIGAVQARLMLYNNKDKINSLGNVTHFLGFGYSEGYGEKYNPPNPLYQEVNEICYPSGAAVLFKAEILKKVGLFDEEFWMYNEDQDLGWRIWLSGFRCVLEPEALVCHKYEFSRSIKKYYWLDRNRLIVILKNYHWATLLLIAPALIMMEIGLIFFAFKGGWLKEKIKIYKYFLSLKNWRYIGRARRQAQSLRRVKDKDIIKLFSGKIWYQEIGGIKLKIANIIFSTFWKLIKVLIVW